MRYELRKWTDSSHTDYTVAKTSDDLTALQKILARPSTPNAEWYRLHIVDTAKSD